MKTFPAFLFSLMVALSFTLGPLFAAQNPGAGQADEETIVISHPGMQRWISMNDSGVISFIGSEPGGDGTTAENIYINNPRAETGNVKLMNPVFEVPNKGLFDPPSQMFSAPMIDNAGNPMVWRYLGSLVWQMFDIFPGPVSPVGTTYVEKWLTLNNAPLLPLQIAMGDGGVTAALPLIMWLNPITGNLHPTPFNPATPWIIVYGGGEPSTRPKRERKHRRLLRI